MKVVVIEPPEPVVTKEEAKRHLVIDAGLVDDDVLIESLILAATAWLDGPAGWLGRALGMQILEWQRCDWPSNREVLPFPPEIEIISVKYIDPSGVEQTWPFPVPLYFEDMPAVRGREGDIKIRYRAGYGAPDASNPEAWVNSAPAPIKTAVLMLVAQWYRTREPITIGDQPYTLPFTVEALLSPYRIW